MYETVIILVALRIASLYGQSQEAHHVGPSPDLQEVMAERDRVRLATPKSEDLGAAVDAPVLIVAREAHTCTQLANVSLHRIQTTAVAVLPGRGMAADSSTLCLTCGWTRVLAVAQVLRPDGARRLMLRLYEDYLVVRLQDKRPAASGGARRGGGRGRGRGSSGGRFGQPANRCATCDVPRIHTPLSNHDGPEWMRAKLLPAVEWEQWMRLQGLSGDGDTAASAGAAQRPPFWRGRAAKARRRPSSGRHNWSSRPVTAATAQPSPPRSARRAAGRGASRRRLLAARERHKVCTNMVRLKQTTALSPEVFGPDKQLQPTAVLDCGNHCGCTCWKSTTQLCAMPCTVQVQR